jgi:(E)-4-hydroxy-3-methyl-but-2-enyl pyrophosphate reductase
MLEVVLSPITGFCFGVKRAMSLIEKGLGRGTGDIFTIGDVIHNPQAVDRLKEMGVVSVSSMDELSDGDTLIVRAHGVMPEIIEEAERRGIQLIDTTCPFVQRSHKYVRRIAKEGRKVIIIGDGCHPEVKGISAQAGREPIIISTPEETESVSGIDKAGVVIQTTFSREKAMRIIAKLEKRVGDLRVHDTICQATTLRREATLKLSRDVDIVLVVGGRGSSNTKRLYQMCIDQGIMARFIETASEIDPSWFEGGERVGLTTGTSTPDWVLEEVVDRLEEISDC